MPVLSFVAFAASANICFWGLNLNQFPGLRGCTRVKRILNHHAIILRRVSFCDTLFVRFFFPPIQLLIQSQNLQNKTHVRQNTSYTVSGVIYSIRVRSNRWYPRYTSNRTAVPKIFAAVCFFFIFWTVVSRRALIFVILCLVLSAHKHINTLTDNRQEIHRKITAENQCYFSLVRLYKSKKKKLF